MEILKNENFEKWKFWKIEILKNGNLEKWKFWKMEILKKDIGKNSNMENELSSLNQYLTHNSYKVYFTVFSTFLFDNWLFMGNPFLIPLAHTKPRSVLLEITLVTCKQSIHPYYILFKALNLVSSCLNFISLLTSQVPMNIYSTPDLQAA